MIKILATGAALALLSTVPAFAACTEISSANIALAGCVDTDLKATETSGVPEFSYLTADQSIGLMIITETEHVAMAQYREAILQNATAGAGGNRDDVRIVRERPVVIDGRTLTLMEYTIPNDGSPILFQNFYYSGEDLGSVQVIAYSLVPDATLAAYSAGAFLSTIKLGKQ